MYKFIRRNEYEYLKYIEQEYHQKCDQNQKLKQEIQSLNELLSALQAKFRNPKTVLYDVVKDRNNNDSYIMMRDKVPQIDDGGAVHQKGSVILFVLSISIHSNNSSECYTDIPYLDARFDKGVCIIDELHCTTNSRSYENMGYGTMLVEAITTLSRQFGCTCITGKLSGVDAKTEKEKQKRNEFYRHRGFELCFDDASQKTGSFRKQLTLDSHL